MTDGTLRDIVLRMEGSMNAGFAQVQGELNLLKRGEREVARDVEQLSEDVEALKGRRWPLPVIGGLIAFSSLGMSAFTLVRGG